MILGKLICKVLGHKVEVQHRWQKEDGKLAFSHKEQYRLITERYCKRCGKLIEREISALYTKAELVKMMKDYATRRK